MTKPDVPTGAEAPAWTDRAWRWYVWIAAALVAGWGLLAALIGPALLRLAYRGEAPGILNRVIQGRDVHPVEYYLSLWQLAALQASIGLVVALGFAALFIWKRSEIRKTSNEYLARIPALRVRDIFVVALAFAIVAGVLEAGWATFEYWVLRRGSRNWIMTEMFWMAPLAASVTLAALAAAVALPGRLLGTPNKLNGALVFALAAICVFGFGQGLRSGLHPVAIALLAGGAAAFVMRGLAGAPSAFLRRARRVAVFGPIVIAAWGLLLVGLGSDVLRGAATRGGADDDSPNILLIVWDTVRARSLSLYGYERQTTPVLDSLGRNGVVFDAAISAAPWTLPSHASLFTGRQHHEFSDERTFTLPERYSTLAEVLRERGYRTGGFVANRDWVGRKYGFGRGFDVYDDRPLLSATTVLQSWHMASVLGRYTVRRLPQRLRGDLRITAEQINGLFLEWVDRDRERPFFAFLNLFDAHQPYLPPGDFGFEFAEGTPMHRWSLWEAVEFSETELQELRDAYDSSIYYLDYQLGRLIEELRRRGLLDNTLLVITADHGESIGEHGPTVVGHSNNVYFDVLNVPLVFHFPGRLRGGVRHLRPVSLTDVGATIVDLSSSRPMTGLAGRSLTPILIGRGGARPTAGPVLSQGYPGKWHFDRPSWPMSKGPLYSLVDGTTHYIVNARGEEQIFDLARDPWELEDRSRTPDGDRDAKRLRATLTDIMGPATISLADN